MNLVATCSALFVLSLLALLIPMEKQSATSALIFQECPAFPAFEAETCIPRFEKDIRLGNALENPLEKDCGNTPIMYAFQTGHERLLRSWLKEKAIQHFVKNSPYFKARCCLEKNNSLFETTQSSIVDLVCSI